MNCGGFKTNFSALIDGELPGALVAEVESHLDKCPRCAGMLKAYRAGVDSLSRSPVEIEPPDDMFERVMAAVEGGAKQARVIPLRTAAGRNILAAAAVVMIALVGSLLFTGGDRNGVAWNPAVDSTVDVVNAYHVPAAGEPETETGQQKRPAQKAYLAAYRPDDGEPALSYGVSSHPVLVESGVYAAE